jgi:lipopolysaccharide/colanic/teichoic acid biosynthesis glycosyltransferase
MSGPRATAGARLAKRLLDLSLALPALVLAAPLIVVIAAAIRLRMGTPVLYRQWRPGLHGEPFEFLKFRTMTTDVDALGNPLPDEERLTTLGRVLRRTSLDELPELWNVVRGEMSIVGPRPLLMEYLPLYTDRLARRHDVPPGITGWAIVNGRRTLSMEERLNLDVWYVDHWSLRLDLEVIRRTVAIVLTGQGAEPPHHHAPDMGWTREAEAARLAAAATPDAAVEASMRTADVTADGVHGSREAAMAVSAASAGSADAERPLSR